MPDHAHASTSRPDALEVPAVLFAHDTGLSAERLRELFAAEDAYTRRPVTRTGDDA